LIKRTKGEVGWANLKAWRDRTPNYQIGPNNPFWKGGTSKSTINRRCKKLLTLVNVDMYTCQSCGKFSTIRHNIHHKDGNRLNNTVENLEVLCSVCHNSGSPLARHPRKRSIKTGRFI